MVRLLGEYFRNSRQTNIDRYIDAEGEMHAAELKNKTVDPGGHAGGGRWLSRSTREDVRAIVYHRFFTYLTYFTITLYMVVRPLYDLRSILKGDGAGLTETRNFCYFLFDLNVTLAFTMEVSLRSLAAASLFDVKETHTAHFRDWGNVFDAVIVTLSWLAYVCCWAQMDYMFCWPVFILHFRGFRFMKPFRGELRALEGGREPTTSQLGLGLGLALEGGSLPRAN